MARGCSYEYNGTQHMTQHGIGLERFRPSCSLSSVSMRQTGAKPEGGKAGMIGSRLGRRSGWRCGVAGGSHAPTDHSSMPTMCDRWIYYYVRGPEHGSEGTRAGSQRRRGVWARLSPTRAQSACSVAQSACSVAVQRASPAGVARPALLSGPAELTRERIAAEAAAHSRAPACAELQAAGGCCSK